MRLTHNHKQCLKDLLDLYKVTFGDNKIVMSLGSAMIKVFLTEGITDEEITNDEFSYISKFDVVSNAPGHKAFADIIRRYAQIN